MINKTMIAVTFIALFYMLVIAFNTGLTKTLDIKENTYYDVELGTMVYSKQ